MNSVAVSLGSEPDTSPRKAGRYLLLNTYMVVKTTGYFFITAMAPNMLAMELIGKVYGSSHPFLLSWPQWFYAASVPGLICLFLTPLVVYFICPPELKKLDNKAIAKKGLEELGPMTVREKTLLGLFILAVLSWALGEKIGIKEASTTAISIMTLLVICGVLVWDDMLKNKGAWNTLVWYGGLLGLSGVLEKAHFFDWLSATMQANLNFGGISSTIATIIILFMSVAVRYLFASGGAYIAAMVPVFAAVGLAAWCRPDPARARSALLQLLRRRAHPLRLRPGARHLRRRLQRHQIVVDSRRGLCLRQPADPRHHRLRLVESAGRHGRAVSLAPAHEKTALRGGFFLP